MQAIARYEHHKDLIEMHRVKIKKCKACMGEGFVFSGKLDNKSATPIMNECKCRLRFMKNKNLILSGIPRKRLRSLKEKRNKIIVRDILSNKDVSIYDRINIYIKKSHQAKLDGIGLMFFGTPGNGKTTASIYLLSKLLNKGYDCYYIYFKDLIGLLIQSYDDKSKLPLFKEIISVDFLIIDELSLVSRVTPHMVSEFTSICKQRFENEKPTILISNYHTTEEIFHNFGSPMESLLNEAFISFKFKDKDLREDKYEYMKKFFE